MRRREDLDRLRLATGEGELAAAEVDGGDLRDRGALGAGRVGAPHGPVGRRLLVALEDRDRPARPQREGAPVPGRRSSGEGPVAAGQCGEHVGGESLVRRRWRGRGQGPVQAVGRFSEVAAVPPQEADMACHLDRRRPVGFGQRALDRRTEVGVLAQHPLAPGDLPPGVPLGAPLVGEAGVVLAMPAAYGTVLAERVQPVGAVLADGVEHPVAGRDHRVGQHDGLCDEPGEQPGDPLRGQRAARAHLLDRLRAEPAGEDGQPRPQQAFEGRAEFVAPADGGAQGLVAGRAFAGGGSEHVQGEGRRSPSRAWSWSRVRSARRAAASSRARGMPSRRRRRRRRRHGRPGRRRPAGARRRRRARRTAPRRHRPPSCHPGRRLPPAAVRGAGPPRRAARGVRGW